LKKLFGNTAGAEHDVVALDLSTAHAQPGAAVSMREGVLHATTSTTAWAYAIVVPLSKPTARRDDRALKVTVELTVKAGAVGVGILNSAESAFLTERLVSLRRGVTVDLTASDAAFGRLVFRNAGLDGASAEFVVKRIVVSWSRRPWPVAVDSRDIAAEQAPPGGGPRVFDDAEALRINQARRQMIEAVGLTLAGTRVLDVGCGVGRFENFYLSQGCEVVALDGRPENIAELRRRHPTVRAIVGDVETFDLRSLGRFDIVHCLGLLYHLENPLAALKNLHRVCDGVLLLETIIVDSKLPMLLLADETKAASQALGGVGCRPSPSYVSMGLNRIGFPCVYGLTSDGEHEDFEFDWRDDNESTRNDHPLRCFFVASQRPLSSSRLVTLVASGSEADESSGAIRLGANAFAINRHEVNAGAVVEGAAPLRVRTPAEPWAYAVGFTPTWPDGADAVDGFIRVAVRVTSGEVSLLALGGDGTRLIDEAIVPSTPEIFHATLPAAPLAACGRLIVRSGRNGGASAEIHAIDCVHLTAAGERPILARRRDLQPVPDWDRYYGMRGDTLDERLRGARYAALDRETQMPWLENLELLIRPNDQLSRAVYVSGTYEPASLLAMKRLLPPGGVFLDLGANVGIYSMLASRWVGPAGRVFSFEPSEREFICLRRHIELNGLSNVMPLRSAVADRDGTFELRVAGFPYAGLNTITNRFAYDGIEASHTEQVEGLTLDRFAERSRLERIDLVKMDVEGGEAAALAGATRVLHEWRPSWIIEVSPERSDSRDGNISAVLGVLHNARYGLFRIDEATAGFVELLGGDMIPAGRNLVAVPVERKSNLGSEESVDG
jgi:FkbM family methyltransferase